MDDTIQYSVLKFGGKSFSTPELLTRVFGIIEREFDLNPKLVLVFSAFQGMTHKLEEIAAKAARGNSDYESEFDDFCAFHIQFARQVIQGPSLNKVLEKLGSQHAALKTVLAGVCILLEATPRTMDYILSFGEFNACFMVESYLQSKMIPVQFVDSRDLVLTDNKFGNATVQLEPTKEQVKRRIYSMGNTIPLVPGFTGATAGGLFTTLGKGSSDYTAALLASALETNSFTIWSTVDGILSADPERVPGAITIPQLSYSEALEMAQVGSRRIHHNAIQIAADSGIAIKLRNVINPDHQGTLIGEGPFRDQRKMI
ncbi:MAG: aspartate kinase, partial [Saprospiraceae bacterium]